MPSRPRRPRRRRLVALLLAPAVALAAAVTLLPTFLLSRAESRAEECMRAIVEQGTGDPDGCLPRDYELALARRLPWLEQEAQRLGVEMRYRAAQLAYGKATALEPGAEARARAAERLLEASGPLTDPASALASLEGAFSEVTAMALASDDPLVRTYAFKSARAVAALDALDELAADGGDEAPPTLELWRGAISCLRGDEARGERALERADRVYRARAREGAPDDAELKEVGEGYGPALLALSACGGEAGERVPEPYRAAATMLAAIRNPRVGVDSARMLLDTRPSPLTGEVRLRVAALGLQAEPDGEPPGAVEALAFLVPRHGPAAALDADALRSPWLVIGAQGLEGLVLVEPQVAERAAAHLEKLAEEVKDEPLECAGAECPVEVALGMPGRLLREGARMLWLEAAAEHARRGAEEPALAAVARATSLTPERRRHESAPVHLAAGDAEGALGAIAPSLAGPLSGAEKSRALVNRALALAHLGKLDQAYAAAEKAFTASLERPRPGEADEPGAALSAEQDRIAAAWLWGALALAADEGGEVIALLKDTGSERLVALSTWLELAAAEESARRPRRWNLSMREPVESVLPAAMYLAGRAVPPEADVEVWLDRVFHEQHRHQPLRSMLARAEAARWRGDGAAEKKWLARARALQKLVRDYPTALLAQLAELR